MAASLKKTGGASGGAGGGAGGEESPYSLAGRSGDDETGDHEVNPVMIKFNLKMTPYFSGKGRQSLHI